MRDFITGGVVCSTAGHDKDEFYVVTGVEKENGKVILYLVNGTTRKLDNPKKKNAKHVRYHKAVIEADESRRLTDEMIKRSLKQYAGGTKNV